MIPASCGQVGLVSNPYRNILSLKAGYLSNVVHKSFQSLQEYPKRVQDNPDIFASAVSNPYRNILSAVCAASDYLPFRFPILTGIS